MSNEKVITNYTKVVRNIVQSETLEQLQTCDAMAKNFATMYSKRIDISVWNHALLDLLYNRANELNISIDVDTLTSNETNNIYSVEDHPNNH